MTFVINVLINIMYNTLQTMVLIEKTNKKYENKSDFQ